MSHFLSLAHGISVCVACGLLFYLAGLAVIPRRWERILQSAALMLMGAAVYVLLCWIAVSSHELPLVLLILAFTAGVAVLSAFRLRWILSIARDRMSFAIGTLFTFSSFYIAAYLLTLPPTSDVFLPPAWTGNLDLLTHVQYAKNLLLFGSSRLETASFDYRENPAVSYLLALLSLGYSQDPLRAAMPLLFSLVSLTAVAVVVIARSLVGLSRLATLAVVSIFLIGPLMRYVSAAYLVAWLAVFPIFMLLLWVVRNSPSTRFIDAPAIAAFAGIYTLLFFVHPAVVGIGIVIQIIAAMAHRHEWRKAERLVVAAAIPIIVLTIAFFDRVRWAIADSRMRSPLALSDLRPQMLVGWPGRIPQQINAELPAGVVTLFLSAITLIFIARLASRLVVNHQFALRQDRRLVRAFVAYAAVVLVLANVAVHAVADPRLIRLPGVWRGIEKVRDQPFTELTFRIEYDPGGLLAAVTRYYLPDKKIDIVSRTVRTRDLPFEMVSRQRPVLLQGFGCEGVGHRDVVSIDRVGCALLAPPTLEIGKRFPFNRTMLAVESDGMGERDPGGRWTTERTLSLRVTIDPERTRVDRTLYLNILVDPFLPAGEKPPRMVLMWGNNRLEALAASGSWISVPVAVGDWSGNRLWALRVRIDFPDRRRILFRDLMLSEEPAVSG